MKEELPFSDAEFTARLAKVRTTILSGRRNPPDFYFPNPQKGFWEYQVSRLDGDHWTEAFPLPNSKGRWSTRVNAAWDQDGDGAEQLRLWLRTLLECLAEEAQLARVCIVDVLSAGPQALEHRERHMHNFAVPLERAAVEHNGGAPAPSLAADGLVAAIYDVIYKLLAQDRADELADLLDDLHSFCLMLFQYSPAPAIPEPR